MSKWSCPVPILLWEMGNLKSSKDWSANRGYIQGPNLKTKSIYPVSNVRPCKNPHAIHFEKQTWYSKIQLLSLWWNFLRPSAVSHQVELLDHFRTSAHLHCACLKMLLLWAFFPLVSGNIIKRASAWKDLIRTWFQLKKHSTQTTSNSNTNCSTSVSIG